MTHSPYDWGIWFAWFPVRVDGRRVWGRTVERRLVGKPVPQAYAYGGPRSGYWEYRRSQPT